MKDFGQVITAMVTPFDSELKVDYAKAKALAEKLVNEGSEGIVVAGTTGESPTLTKDEKLKLFTTVKDAVGKKAAVIAGTGSNSTQSSVELSMEAEKTGVDALLVVAPYYNKPPQEGIYRHFKEVAGATSLPVIVYNIPGRTGVNITPDTIARMAEIPNIAAVKESCGNLEQISEVWLKASKVNKNFKVYSGDDALTLPILSIGGCGVISVASHLAGNLLRKMISSFFEGKVKEAVDIHTSLFPLFKGLFLTTNPIMVKAALGVKNFDAGGVRPPLVSATEDDKKKIKTIMEQVGIA